MSKLVFIQDIDLKASPMVRHVLHKDVVEDYAAIIKQDARRLPPIELFLNRETKQYLVGDGMHRLHAHIACGQKTIIANVTTGSYEDALKYALVANDKHGLRRSREDKRQCVQQAIKQWPTISNRQLAEFCAVDDHTIATIREIMEKAGKVAKVTRRLSSDGRVQPASQQSKEHPVAKEKSSAEFRTAPKKLEITDPHGTVIPAFALDFWERAGEAKDLIEPLKELSEKLKAFEVEEDLMYVELNFNAIKTDIDHLITSLSVAIPFAVCTQCNGHPKTQPKGDCRMCKGRGLISRFRWNTLVPEEIRNMKKVRKLES